MKKLFLLLVLLLLTQYVLIAQNNDWQVMPGSEDSGSYHLLTKQDNNITYMMDSDLSIKERDRFVANTKEYITKDLKLLQEMNFNTPAWILISSDRFKRYKHGIKTLYSLEKDDISSITLISSFYDEEHCPLNLGLMKVIAAENWGEINDNELIWLEEGLASYATPEAYNCDGYSFEKRYIGFIQRGKLTNILQFPPEEDLFCYKTACNQSAYIVEYLLEHHGIKKLKELWQGGVAKFQSIYGITFYELTEKLNHEFFEKYPELIPFDWEEFNKDCVELENNGWLSGIYYDKMDTKEIENLKFTVNSTMSMQERDSLIIRTKKYIIQNLELINEYSFSDSVHIILASSQAEMDILRPGKVGGEVILKDGISVTENTIYATYGDKQSPLKHELMHLIAMIKWRNNISSAWLNEGLAVYANPGTLDCDGHTLEERYVYFLQNDKLMDTDRLLTNFFPDDIHDIIRQKIAYTQAGYIVGYLIENYGVKKLKRLWQNGRIWPNGDDCFVKIYGISFENLIRKINQELNEKYPKAIESSWTEFLEGC